MLSASYYRDGYVLADYLKTRGIQVLKHASYPMDQLFELLWRDPDLKPLEPCRALPLTRYFGFPYGWMVARTGWDESSVICEMKVNAYNFLNHQHHDAGAFQIYYQGPLAMDTGIYEGDDGGYLGPHNVNYYKRTIAHNSLLVFDPDEKFITDGFRNVEKVNDGGQRLPNRWRSAGLLEDFLAADYRTGSIEGRWFGPDPQRPAYSYLKGDITLAYSKKVKEVKRSFAFLNLGDPAVPAALVVFDKVVASDPSFKKYWLLHGMEEPRIEGGRVEFALTRRGWSGKLVSQVLLPEADNRELTPVGGPGKEFWVFGRNFASQPLHDPEDYELGEWRVELSPVRAAAEDHFLNVLLVTGRENDCLPAVELVAGEGLAGAKVADRVVLFRRDGARSDLPQRFALSGAGSFQIMVADLAAGSWQVRKDGAVLVPAALVNAEEGVLCFEGGAGCYELLR